MRVVPLVVVLALATSAGATAQPAAVLEYEVKAAFLYNFAKFVEWPPDAFTGRDAPVTLCVVGSDPFGRVLDETVSGERLDEHPLAVARYLDAPPLGGCHVVYVSSSERGRYQQLLASIDRQRTLTVGDGVGFLDAGGYLAFYLDNGRVRFAVNSDVAGTSGLKVSSKLLRVAVPYKPRAEGPR